MNQVAVVYQGQENDAGCCQDILVHWFWIEEAGMQNGSCSLWQISCHVSKAKVGLLGVFHGRVLRCTTRV